MTLLSAGIVNRDEAAGPATPPQATHYYPMDEGSGDTLFDAVGDVDMTLSGGYSWISDSAFEGGVAPSLDGSDGYASGDLNTSVPFTLTLRVRMDNPDESPNVFAFNHDPQLYSDNGEWNTDYLTVADAEYAAGDERIFVFQRGNGTTRLFVYDGAGTVVGSNSTSTFQSFSTGVMYLGQVGDDQYWLEGAVDQLTITDSYLSSAAVESLIDEYYL